MSSKPKEQKVPLSLRAVVQRINRALKDEGKGRMLRGHRGRTSDEGPQGYELIDTKKGTIEFDVDLDELGHKLTRKDGQPVLGWWEKLED